MLHTGHSGSASILIEMLLKGLVALCAILAMVDFTMASRAYRTYPTRMVRPAVCHAFRMVGFQIGRPVLSTEWSFTSARFATSPRPFQDISFYSRAPLEEATPASCGGRDGVAAAA